MTVHFKDFANVSRGYVEIEEPKDIDTDAKMLYYMMVLLAT